MYNYITYCQQALPNMRAGVKHDIVNFYLLARSVLKLA